VPEAEIHRWLSWGVMGVGLVVFGLLFSVSAPYGRHGRSGWGPTMSTRWAWIVMESPAVLLFVWVYAQGQHRMAPAPLILLFLWQVHYVNRTFIYPFRLRGGDKSTPVLVAVLAFGFQLVNSYLNARHISHLGHYGPEWIHDPRLWIGVGLFMTGRRINLWSDAVLRGLRKQDVAADAAPAERYAIPRGGLYEWVSCPNYFGECVEWLGWAIASWSLAGASFAVFTFANLAPRAIAHHRWYRETFPDYPRDRRAILPGLW